MTTRNRILCLAFLAVAPARSTAQFLGGQELEQARTFAGRALDGYVTAAVRDENAPRLGFKDAKEARAARLGDPLPVLFVGLAELKAYRPGTGAGTVLSNMRTLWFPVLVNGEVRSKLEITEIHGKWTAGEFGRPSSARQLMRVKGELPRALQGLSAPPDAKVALVRIPSLDVELFYVSGAGGELFVPIRGQALPPELEPGKAYPADAVLSRLAAAARTVPADKVR